LQVRSFVEKEMIPNVSEWEEAGDYPSKELHRKAYEAGVLAAMWPVQYGGTPPEVGAWCMEHGVWCMMYGVWHVRDRLLLHHHTYECVSFTLRSQCTRTVINAYRVAVTPSTI